MQDIEQPSTGGIDLTTLVCSQHKQAHMICITKDCKNYALSCRQINCPCQTQEHLGCDFRLLKSFVSRLLQKRKKIPEETLKAVQYLLNIYQRLIQQLSVDKQRLSNWKQHFGLTHDQINVLQSLQSQDPSTLIGLQTFNAVRSEFLNPEHVNFTQERVKLYWESKEWIINDVVQHLRIPFQRKSIDEKAVQRFMQTSNEMKWAIFYGSKHIKIENSSITCTEGKQTIQLLTPFFVNSILFKQKKVWSFSIEKVPWNGHLKIGICLYLIVKKNKFSMTQQDHGCYLFSQNGTAFQHHKVNKTLIKHSQFNINDIMHLLYDPNTNLLSLKKNISQQVFKIQVLDPPPDDFYCPCVVLDQGANVKILQENSFARWRQSPKK